MKQKHIRFKDLRQNFDPTVKENERTVMGRSHVKQPLSEFMKSGRIHWPNRRSGKWEIIRIKDTRVRMQNENSPD